MSADGSRVAVGAYRNDGNGVDSGHVRIYDWDGVNWNQLGADIDGEAAGDFSGDSVSLNADGSRVAVGAPINEGSGGNSGHARIYEWDGTSWNQLGLDIDGEAFGDVSGSSVSLSNDGSILAIGAPFNDGNGVDSGHARIYEWNGASWNQLGLDINGEESGDFFGWSVSLSADGNSVAIGAISNDGNGVDSGHVRIYQWDGIAWSQAGQDIDGEATLDWFGFSVSLSDDGSRVAVGAISNDGNGSNSGHIRIYDWDGTSWNQVGQDIDGEAAGDESGYSVSLNADGAVVAIGAIANDEGGVQSGHVRIYDSRTTAIPDPNFEQALIDLGIDSQGVLNGYVYTADISGVISLNIPGVGIEDLTGIEDFAALQILNCNNNAIIQADFSSNAALTALNISNNSLTALNVMGTRLQELQCNGNQLTSIDIIDLGSLEILYCHENQLTTLNIADLSDLQLLHCYNNQLTGSLNLFEIAELQDFDATNNPGLACIQVQEPEEAEAQEGIYANWFKDPATAYASDCGAVAMMDRRAALAAIPPASYNITQSNTGIEDTHNGFALYQNAPNPFEKTTTINAIVPETVQQAKLVVYTLQGIELKSYAITARGHVSVELSGGHFPQGIYVYALVADSRILDTGKMIVTK